MQIAAARRRAGKRRVLFIINSLSGGGAERVMTLLLKNSAAWAERYEIGLAVLDDEPRAFEDLPKWLEVFQLDARGRTLRSVSEVRRIVRQYEPDIGISFLTRANVANGIAMMKRHRPWIISERTSTPGHSGGMLRQLVTRSVIHFVYPHATHVIAVSAGVADQLSRRFGVDRAKVTTIPNPVDLKAIEAASRKKGGPKIEPPYIIGLGRLVGAKNFALLIHAFAKSDLAGRLVIVGEGPERSRLKDLAARLGIDDRVAMPGWLSNPYPLLRNASVFALSSNIEGFPNALIEALALGVPVVATNCRDGPSEILEGIPVDATSELTVAAAGILTPVGDVDSFAKALGIAFDQRQSEAMASAGKERIKDFSARSVASRYWDIIEAQLQRSDEGLATIGAETSERSVH